jgi:hypothetical protein
MTRLLTAALLFLIFAPLLRAAEPTPTPAQFKALCALAQDMDHTTIGEGYEESFTNAISDDMRRALKACTAHTQPPYEIDLVFVINADGKVDHIFSDPESPISACVAGKLDRERLPPPPKGKQEWLMLVNINIH